MLERITLIRKQRSSPLLLSSVTCSSAVDLVDCFYFYSIFLSFPNFFSRHSRLSIWLFVHFFLNLWHATPWLRIEALLLSKFSFRMMKKTNNRLIPLASSQVSRQNKESSLQRVFMRGIWFSFTSGRILKNSINLSAIR